MTAAVEPSSLRQVSDLYSIVLKASQQQDRSVLGVDINHINARLLNDISDSVADAVSSIRTKVADGLTKSKRIDDEAATLPEAFTRELKELPEKLGINALDDIYNKVMQLLANFHAASELPNSLYPRLICGNVPIDPLKVTNFSKKHRILEKLNDADTAVSNADRSMSAPPSSSPDVIAKVTSSAQSLSDDVTSTMKQVTDLRKDFDELRNSAETFNDVRSAIATILNEQEEISGMVNRIRSMFTKDDASSVTSRAVSSDTETKPDVIRLVQEGCGLVDEIRQKSSSVEDATLKVRSVAGTFGQVGSNIRERFEKVKLLFGKLEEVLKTFLANLPRLIREIRQFFVPQGWRVFLMRTSDDLVAMLHQIEEVKSTIPDPAGITESMKKAISESESADKMDTLKCNIDELVQIPAGIMREIQEQNLQQKLIDSVMKSLSSIADELKESAIGGVMDHVGDVLGMNELSKKVENYVPFGDSMSNSNSSSATNKGLSGLVHNLTGAGALKSIF